MRHRTTSVEDIMTTALMTVRPDETVDNVDLEMRFATVRHIPVVGPGNRLVGIVSDRDLLRTRAKEKTRPIAEIMTRQIHTVGADEPASKALDILMDRRIGCVPVLGDDRQLVGIVTETDFLRVAREALRD